MTRLLTIVVGMLSFMGIAASIDYFFHEPYNPRFEQFPNIVAMHVILGGIYLALAPWQFVTKIRRRWLALHRWLGRLLVLVGIPLGATAIFIPVVIPFSGWPERIIVGGFGVYFFVALALGYRHIRAQQVMQHREWMLRAFAIGLGIATMRILFVLQIGGPDEPTIEEAEFASIAAFTIAFVLHSLIAELWIRRTAARRC